ncbi:MAG: PDZ domain-containing protein [Thermomicrobiales bacterium]|nr:PDZ domain-containing protein [Thermomicrobiales bacterium]
MTAPTPNPTAQPQVTVYSTQTCPWCDKTKEYLKANGVPFVEKKVDVDRAAAYEMVRLTGQQGVPVTAAGDEVILGFDQQKLARVVSRFAGPKRPALGLLGAEAESYFRNHPDIAATYPEGIKGIYVGQVRPDSVAAHAGLQPGDVIAAAAGKRVANIYALDRLIETLKPGESISIRYYRGQEDFTGTLQF